MLYQILPASSGIPETKFFHRLFSQFTLTASTRKGNRPSYIRAAGHELATHLYELYMAECERLLGHPVERGHFGADMQVSLVNSGPVTIIIDSRLRE